MSDTNHSQAALDRTSEILDGEGEAELKTFHSIIHDALVDHTKEHFDEVRRLLWWIDTLECEIEDLKSRGKFSRLEKACRSLEDRRRALGELLANASLEWIRDYVEKVEL